MPPHDHSIYSKHIMTLSLWPEKLLLEYTCESGFQCNIILCFYWIKKEVFGVSELTDAEHFQSKRVHVYESEELCFIYTEFPVVKVII